MKTTMTLAVNLKCSPFEIFDQDCDEVIMLINFYIYHGEEEKENKNENKLTGGHKDDGFWDM